VLCFENFVNANFTIRRENWPKSLAALGKKIRRILKITHLRAQHAVEEVWKPIRTGRPGPGDLIAAAAARARAVATGADQPSRFGGVREDVVHRFDSSVPHVPLLLGFEPCRKPLWANDLLHSLFSVGF
jgi:hypothetical protein